MKISRLFKDHAVPFIMAWFLVISTLAAPISASAEAVNEATLNWIQGSNRPLPVGTIAQVSIKEDYLFLNGADTKSFIRQAGQLPSNQEVGAIFPIDEDAYWVAYFEYVDSGHISDEEKTNINVDKLLDRFKKGTEQANKEIAEENHLYVDGWDIPPTYNESSRSLTWSLLLHDYNGDNAVNYHVRILTRTGYLSVILASDLENQAANRATLERDILPNLRINPGQTYEDFDPSVDKQSSVGLTGLILGGAGLAVAKKAGLFGLLAVLIKKIWFVVILPFVWLFSRLP
ncbi:DUF2167 domain-containing protein [Paenibacillus ihumii]|uniref:DUF2167 domain-containing protein n=1 Tax=Paenibacillus ihumii TaxID=687436 RepID=UPI0006D76419|nr:DUF2167 domain-containing protein [Paenibacillus ihumii]